MGFVLRVLVDFAMEYLLWLWQTTLHYMVMERSEWNIKVMVLLGAQGWETGRPQGALLIVNI